MARKIIKTDTAAAAIVDVAPAMSNGVETREAWLNLVVTALRPLFADGGFVVPENVKVSCGFPSRSATARKAQRIGECWDSTRSGSNHFEIFISPVLADASRVVDVLAHELIHATVGLKAGHGAPFKRCMAAIGLEGKATATVAGAKFRAWFEGQEFPPYPHAELNATSAPKKAPTRLLKVYCPACAEAQDDYLVRMSAKAFGMGAPICPTHHVSMKCDVIGEPSDGE